MQSYNLLVTAYRFQELSGKELSRVADPLGCSAKLVDFSRWQAIAYCQNRPVREGG
jgi:hypothetical protein